MGVTRSRMLLGKLVPYFAINLLQVGSMLCVGVYLVPLCGGDALTLGQSPAALVVMALAVSFASVSYALLIANVVTTARPRSSRVSAICCWPSGQFVVPRFVMPQAMQAIGSWSPIAWGLEGFLDIFLRRGGVDEVGGEAVWLGAFGIACLLGAALFMGRRRAKIGACIDREQLKRELKLLLIQECKDLKPGKIADDAVLIGGRNGLELRFARRSADLDGGAPALRQAHPAGRRSARRWPRSTAWRTSSSPEGAEPEMRREASKIHVRGLALECALGRELPSAVDALERGEVRATRLTIDALEPAVEMPFYRVGDGAELGDPRRYLEMPLRVAREALRSAGLWRAQSWSGQPCSWAAQARRG